MSPRPPTMMPGRAAEELVAAEAAEIDPRGDACLDPRLGVRERIRLGRWRACTDPPRHPLPRSSATGTPNRPPRSTSSPNIFFGVLVKPSIPEIRRVDPQDHRIRSTDRGGIVGGPCLVRRADLAQDRAGDRASTSGTEPPPDLLDQLAGAIRSPSRPAAIAASTIMVAAASLFMMTAASAPVSRQSSASACTSRRSCPPPARSYLSVE